jgi:putative ATPase
MQVYVLQALTQDELDALLHRACQQDDWLRSLQTELQETDALFALSGGDGRKALSLLELVAQEGAARALRHGEPLRITNEAVEAVAQARVAAYDKNGEQHYDVISAFIKSIRGGDPNAGVYWLARMLHGGEDPKFIARRLVILASEDIGNANPNALLLATGTFQAVDMIGMPEARIILSQCVTYLATSPKSNASYLAINQALDWVRQNPDHPVPLHLRNAPTDLMRQQGYGLGYKYSHEWDWQDPAANQEYLPEVLRGKAFYQPKAAGREADIRRYMAHKWKDPYGYE